MKRQKYPLIVFEKYSELFENVENPKLNKAFFRGKKKILDMEFYVFNV